MNLIFYQGLSLSNIGSKLIPNISGFSFGYFLSLAFWIFVVIVGIWSLISFIRGKIKYKYRAEIIKRRANNWETNEPTSKIIGGKAGYFKVGNTGRDVFRIKYGIFPWQILDIKKLPDPKYMEDNKVYFIQYNIGEIAQAKRTINWKSGGIEIEPVDSTTKDAMKTEIRDYKNIFSWRSKLMENAGIFVLGFILVGGMVVYYFLSKTCG